MSIPDAATPAGGSARPGGVIHDLGYRGYAGPRNGSGRIALALFRSGLGALFGFGRPAKAKIRPFGLLAICVVPALVMVAVLVFTSVRELPLSYADFPAQLQLMISLFAAMQAPLLFSADQRCGVVSLYFARPTGPVTYALARLGSLLAGVLIFMWVPMIVLYAGALLGELGAGQQTRELLVAMGVSALLGLAITGVAGAISAFSVRRGFAVLAIIAVLLVLDGVVAGVGALASQSGSSVGAELIGLASPYSLYRGCTAIVGASELATAPNGLAMRLAYFVGLLVFAAIGAAASIWRMRKVAGR